MADDALVDRIATQLQETGEARLRSGERRSAQAARALLKAAADSIGADVKITKLDSGYVAETK